MRIKNQQQQETKNKKEHLSPLIRAESRSAILTEDHELLSKCSEILPFFQDKRDRYGPFYKGFHHK